MEIRKSLLCEAIRRWCSCPVFCFLRCSRLSVRARAKWYTMYIMITLTNYENISGWICDPCNTYKLGWKCNNAYHTKIANGIYPTMQNLNLGPWMPVHGIAIMLLLLELLHQLEQICKNSSSSVGKSIRLTFKNPCMPVMDNLISDVGSLSGRYWLCTVYKNFLDWSIQSLQCYCMHVPVSKVLVWLSMSSTYTHALSLII